MKLELHPDQIETIGHGANRYTIVHPLNAAHCLKLPVDAQPRSRLNQLEFTAYQILMSKQLLSETFFVQCFGLIETNLGQALEVERLFLAHHQPAVSLYDWLQSEKLQAQYQVQHIVQMIDQFTDFLVQHDLPIFDLNSGNFMLCQQHGRLLLKYVDVKSLLQSKEIIPVSRWFKRLMHKKIKRRSARLKTLVKQRVQKI